MLTLLLSIILGIVLVWIKFKKEEVIPDDEKDEAKIVIDPGKALAQRIKFVMRLKRRMKEFKARKNDKIAQYHD